MPNNIRTGYAPVQGGELYYEVTDAKADAGELPGLLLIHAGVADCTMWDEQINEFSNHFCVIRFDSRGYGRSRTQSVTYSNRQDIVDLLDHLGVLKTCVLGLSRGGQMAIDFTVEHPERSLALIAVAAGVSGFQYVPGTSPKAQIEMAMFSEMEVLEEKGDIEALNEMEVCLWADGPGQPAGRAEESVRQRVRRMNLATFNRSDGKPTPIPLEPPALGRLAEITRPTLVVVGDLDTTAVLEVSELLASGIPGARKLVIPGVAHMVNMEQPTLFNQSVLSFLREAIKSHPSSE